MGEDFGRRIERFIEFMSITGKVMAGCVLLYAIVCIGGMLL